MCIYIYIYSYNAKIINSSASVSHVEQRVSIFMVLLGGAREASSTSGALVVMEMVICLGKQWWFNGV